MADKLKIGISIGDINGIGLEIILKTVAHGKIKDICVPIIYGSSKIVSYHKNIVSLDELQFHSVQDVERINPNRVNVVNVWQDDVNITLGKVSESGGKFALQSLEAATQDLKNGRIDALVTAPINKEAMKLVGFPFPGHTEYLAHQLDADRSLMMMVSDDLRIGLLSNHLPLRDAVEAVSKARILEKIKLFSESLKVDFGIERPTIAVLGLNPHAGEAGVMGEEEDKDIRPAVVESKKNGTLVFGPFPADGFFGSGQYKKFDGVLAMYHDQGLIPFKALTFGHGVNYTAGLPKVRTSPDHGTAFDIAGKNLADPSSFRKAIFLSMDIAQHRLLHREIHANTLIKREKAPEDSNANVEEIEGLE